MATSNQNNKLEWINCYFDLKRISSKKETIINLSPSLDLIHPHNSEELLDFDCKIKMEKPFLFNEKMGWLWHKSWNIPSIEVQVEVDVTIVKPIFDNLEHFHILDLGIKGNSRHQVKQNKCVISGLKFATTSYNHLNSKFHILMMFYIDNKKDLPKIIKSKISSPIYVDSRKTGKKDSQKQRSQMLSSFIDPFLPENLDKQFVKRNNKKNCNEEEKIENDFEGLCNYISAPNIRHKVKHPFFFCIKFSRTVNLYYNKEFINPKNEEDYIEKTQVLMFEFFMKNKLSRQNKNTNNFNKPLILKIKECDKLNTPAKNKRILEFKDQVENAFMQVVFDPVFIPSNYVLIDNIENMKNSYKNLYPKLTSLKFDFLTKNNSGKNGKNGLLLDWEDEEEEESDEEGSEESSENNIGSAMVKRSAYFRMEETNDDDDSEEIRGKEKKLKTDKNAELEQNFYKAEINLSELWNKKQEDKSKFFIFDRYIPPSNGSQLKVAEITSNNQGGEESVVNNEEKIEKGAQEISSNFPRESKKIEVVSSFDNEREKVTNVQTPEQPLFSENSFSNPSSTSNVAPLFSSVKMSAASQATANAEEKQLKQEAKFNTENLEKTVSVIVPIVSEKKEMGNMKFSEETKISSSSEQAKSGTPIKKSFQAGFKTSTTAVSLAKPENPLKPGKEKGNSKKVANPPSQENAINRTSSKRKGEDLQIPKPKEIQPQSKGLREEAPKEQFSLNINSQDNRNLPNSIISALREHKAFQASNDAGEERLSLPQAALQPSINQQMFSLNQQGNNSQQMLQQILLLQKANSQNAQLGLKNAVGSTSGVSGLPPGLMFNKELLGSHDNVSSYLQGNHSNILANIGTPQNLLVDEAVKAHLLRMEEAQNVFGRSSYDNQLTAALAGGRISMENQIVDSSDIGLRSLIGQGSNNVAAAQQEYERRMIESLIKREEMDKMALLEQEFQYQLQQQQYMNSINGINIPNKPYPSQLAGYQSQVISNPFLQQAISQQRHQQQQQQHQHQQQLLLGLGNPTPSQMNLMMYGNYPYENGPIIVPSGVNIYPSHSFGTYAAKPEPSNYFY